MNFIERVKMLPSGTRRLLSIGIIMALVVALPLFIWAIITGNFNLNKKAVSGEPVPTPIAITPINWSTGSVQITADDFYVLSNGKRYTGELSNVTINPSVSTPISTSIEVISNAYGDDLRLNLNFGASTTNWWVENIRIYNNNYSNNWITYTGPFANTALGYAYQQFGLSTYVINNPDTNQPVAEVHFTNLRVQAFMGSSTPPPTYSPSPTATATSTPYPTATPTGNVSQSFTLRMKFAGVTDGSADGAKVTLRFQNSPNFFNYVTSPITVTHIGNGVYQAVLTFGSAVPPLPANSYYAIYLKGEKHLATKFCQQTGQATRCTGNGNISIPAATFNPASYVLEFTGLPLEPGDLYPQDGIANNADFTKIKDLLNKPCASLTATEKLTADLDYNGCVNVRDAFLMRQTLQTRYDEN